MRPQISILTDPTPIGRYFILEPTKKVVRRVRDALRPQPVWLRSEWRGHFSVTRSMVEGLRKIGVSVTYNPQRLESVGEVVIAPGGYAALAQAIEWKRQGFIKRLLVGPNQVDFPSEQKALICAPEIDTLIVHCEWFRDNFINDSPELTGKIALWPAGVDTDYWKPAPAKKDIVLIYNKQAKGYIPTVEFENYILKQGYKIERIQYDQYTHPQYLELLQRASLMVGFVTNESQGIAWSEAWSVDVPTLLWNQDSITYKGRTYPTTTAPYLSQQTGRFFRSLAEFEHVFTEWEKNPHQFSPRQHVLAHLSDEASARQLCDIATVSCERVSSAA